MAIAKAERQRIEAQIAALEQRLAIDSNDLDYETHLHAIRTLRRILSRAGAAGEGPRRDAPPEGNGESK